MHFRERNLHTGRNILLKAVDDRDNFKEECILTEINLYTPKGNIVASDVSVSNPQPN